MKQAKQKQFKRNILSMLLFVVALTAETTAQAWGGIYLTADSQKSECPTSIELMFDHGTYSFILKINGLQAKEVVKMGGINQPESCVDGEQPGFRECFQTQATGNELIWNQTTHFVPSAEIFGKRTIQLNLNEDETRMKISDSSSGMGKIPASTVCEFVR